jgi:Na+-translocating ferredoxin:NAD+ oxidoreductase RnfE subunit
MDGHSLNFNAFVHSEEDALFPAPVGIVLDFNLSEDNSARIAFEQLRLSDKQSSLQLVLLAAFAPGLAVSKTPLIFMLLAVLLDLLDEVCNGVFLFFATTQLIKEPMDHFFEELTAMVTVVTVMSKSVVSETVSESAWLSLLLLLAVFFFVKHSNHDSRSTTWISDLEEGVFVTQIVFAFGAVVEVLADCTLVSDTNNRIHSAAIALDSGVFNKWLLRLFDVLA